MERSKRMAALIFPILVLALFLAGCPKRPGTSAVSAPPPTEPAPVAAAPAGPARASATPAASSPSAAASAPSTPATPRKPGEFTATSHLTDIHFDFDKYEIRPAEAKILEADAGWLKSNTDLVLIEGHCDERGTNEYNVALGERRAKATMNHLVAHGVRASRISIISYGKERPLCAQHNESCWSKNRRAHFLVKPG